MYVLAYAFQLLATLFALTGSALGVALLWKSRATDLKLMETLNAGAALCLGLASCILLYALARSDFSVEYVFNYTDRALPLFYRLTAFWGGQAGSLLFWGLMVAVCGAGFQCSASYRRLRPETRVWFWVFFLGVIAFFGLLLCTWSNPFIQFDQTPPDGRGLNPLLQNPGMIIHPPLLFLGYGGFVIPGCLALAQAMRRSVDKETALFTANTMDSTMDNTMANTMDRQDGEESWLTLARPFTLSAWLFLTAGIVLGGWWAYRELGWGGYWAWDPVENASLIPWLVGTAALHTGLIEQRRGKLRRVTIFLMVLTTISAFFATYLVRGNVVNSVHAFGAGSVGPALLAFVLVFLLIAVMAAWQGGLPDEDDALAGLETKEGFLVMSAWLFLAISVVILLATLWPVISSLWSDRQQGLTADFYNRVCLPLFSVLLALLAVCPWLGWGGGVRRWPRFGAVIAVFAAGLGLFWVFGVREPLPLMSAALCVACLASVLLMLSDKAVFRNPRSLGAWCVHGGLALVALGISFSGPYKTEIETGLAIGQSVELDGYTVTLAQLYEGRDREGSFTFLEAELRLSQEGRDLGTVSPQRRSYAKFPGQAFSESATRFSLGKEFYASLLGLDSQNQALLRLSVHPLVNWLWIGGLIMTLAPFLSLARAPRRGNQTEGAERTEWTDQRETPD